MKRNSICYLLIIIASIFTFNVKALPTGEFNVTVSFGAGGGTTSVSYVNPNGSSAYHYYNQNFAVNGESTLLKSYCTWPGYSAQPGWQGTCSVASPALYPTTYKLLEVVTQEGITDEHILDIAFRMAGQRDRINNGTGSAGGDGLNQAFHYTDLIIRGRISADQAPFKLTGGYMDQVTALMQRVGEPTAQDMANVTPNTNSSETGSIFTIEEIESGTDYKIYQVRSSVNIESRPNHSSSVFHVDWVEDWNGTSGKVKVSLLNRGTCSGTLSFSARTSVGNQTVIYACKLSATGGQHYVAIGPSNNSDTFNISLCASRDCACGLVEKKTELKEIDIHNCCEEGAVSKVRQAALNELFCRDNALKVDYYKEKCNAEEYENEDADYEFCKQYCGVTGMYDLPGPTHARVDAYFLFTSKNGVTGPTLTQYKRCRTIINFNVWYEHYKTNNSYIRDALNNYNYNMAKVKSLESASSQVSIEQITCANNSRLSVTYTKRNAGTVTYQKYEVDNDNSYTRIGFKNAGTDSFTGGTYIESVSYNQEQYNNLHCTAVIPSANYNDELNSAKEAATSAMNNYNSLVNNNKELRNGLTQCSGEADASGKITNIPINEKVKFKSEPEMEFSYSQTYLADNGKLENQELSIDFVKDNGKCVVTTNSTLDKPNYKSADWNENWDLFKIYNNEDGVKAAVGIYDDNYSGIYGTGVLSVDTLKNLSYGELAGSINDIKDAQYYASKKFTTDAVSKMTCKWTDSSDNKTYTLVPRGTMITKESFVGDIKDLGGQYTTHTGKYQIVKTHAKGKFETYFTLKNFGDGVFDPIIHNGGKTCSELYADINGENPTNRGDGINTTCYLDIESNGFSMYDCTEKKVVNGNSSLEDTCCVGGNCTLNNVIDYKEVDPNDPFPNEYSSNYAYNWLHKDDSDESKHATEVLNRIKDTASKDATYSKEELTYSFTLTPKDLKAIRAYNQSRIKYGGYADFNMDCHGDKDSDQPLTQCKSYFLEAISGKRTLVSDGVKLELTTSNNDLYSVRSKFKWN